MAARKKKKLKNSHEGLLEVSSRRERESHDRNFQSMQK